MLSGAQGKHATDVNGSLEPTGVAYNGRMLYQSMSDKNTWLRFTKSGLWMVSGSAAKNENTDGGRCKSTTAGLK